MKTKMKLKILKYLRDKYNKKMTKLFRANNYDCKLNLFKSKKIAIKYEWIFHKWHCLCSVIDLIESGK